MSLLLQTDIPVGETARSQGTPASMRKDLVNDKHLTNNVRTVASSIDCL